MKHLTSVAALACLAFVNLSDTAHAANTYKTNPAGLAYRSTVGAAAYGNPGGLVITGNCNSDEPVFVNARANGAELIRYLAPVNVITHYTCKEDAEFYGNWQSTPKWPYPSAGARSNFPNTLMTDIRKGSVWSNRVVAYVEQLMREDKVDGVFLDVLGARIWNPLANWNSWPQWERDQWTDGAVDLVRRLDAKRRAINPRFIIMNNNVWDRGGGDTRGQIGEKYVDGVILEHHPYTSTYHRNYVGRAFSNIGHRRLVIIARSATEARNWATVQGVTHVSSNMEYLQVTPPPVAFHRLTDRPLRFGKAGISGATFSPGMAANYKRGSKFSLSNKGQLLKMAAYLDGNGGPSGSQSVRVALYKDNGGAPGALVAQSNPVSIAADTAPRWVYFPAPATALNPGAYWLMVHSGSNNAVARVASSGDANWRGNPDLYSDGPSNPGGGGSLGTTTVNVFAQYTRGY